MGKKLCTQKKKGEKKKKRREWKLGHELTTDVKSDWNLGIYYFTAVKSDWRKWKKEDEHFSWKINDKSKVYRSISKLLHNAAVYGTRILLWLSL